jgi:RsiW-degrading membrane proteinase PrsW (M82 family)
MLIIAGIIAVLLPLVFLYIIYALDLYSSGSFRTVAICFVWGLVAFGFAFLLNTGVNEHVLQGQLNINRFRAFTLTVVLVAPIVEELVKSLALIYFGRRPDFTYFVDGAIYGFAAGIGFSILENFWYMSQAGGAEQGPVLVISRSFSTCLMHGSASALVGVSIGRFRYGHGRARVLSTILGWGAAMVLHSVFNRVVEFWDGAALLVGAVGIGIGGMILIALFIRWGLAEEKKWIEDTLGLDLRVTEKEKALVRQLQDVDELLEPIRDRFGDEKTAQVEEFLVKQAQLGIKQKTSGMTTDDRLRQQLQAQVQELQAEIDELRRQVGVYCMTYVRSIFPLELVVQWMSDLERRVEEAKQKPAQYNLWGKLQSAADSRMETGPESEA